LQQACLKALPGGAGKSLRFFGAAGALASVPAVSIFTTLALAAHPYPSTLLVAESLRKVAVYTFAKPARELLFTQLSADAKYKAKLVLDTVVQRSGDAAGAAIFAMLGELPTPSLAVKLLVLPCQCSRLPMLVAFYL
jgi:ATP:ADP antiporter, AAA family